jgi:hypothetical protein
MSTSQNEKSQHDPPGWWSKSLTRAILLSAPPLQHPPAPPVPVIQSKYTVSFDGVEEKYVSQFESDEEYNKVRIYDMVSIYNKEKLAFNMKGRTNHEKIKVQTIWKDINESYRMLGEDGVERECLQVYDLLKCLCIYSLSYMKLKMQVNILMQEEFFTSNWLSQFGMSLYEDGKTVYVYYPDRIPQYVGHSRVKGKIIEIVRNAMLVHDLFMLIDSETKKIHYSFEPTPDAKADWRAPAWKGPFNKYCEMVIPSKKTYMYGKTVKKVVIPENKEGLPIFLDSEEELV